RILDLEPDDAPVDGEVELQGDHARRVNARRSSRSPTSAARLPRRGRRSPRGPARCAPGSVPLRRPLVPMPPGLEYSAPRPRTPRNTPDAVFPRANAAIPAGPVGPDVVETRAVVSTLSTSS